jgi:hypothetical protein
LRMRALACLEERVERAREAAKVLLPKVEATHREGGDICPASEAACAGRVHARAGAPRRGARSISLSGGVGAVGAEISEEVSGDDSEDGGKDGGDDEGVEHAGDGGDQRDQQVVERRDAAKEAEDCGQPQGPHAYAYAYASRRRACT